MEKENTTDLLLENYNFNLSDFALFLSVMKNKTAYENVLSIIMNEDELELSEVKVEQVILNNVGKRAIRLDAWAVDKNNRQFNTEMQNDALHDDIRKRSRYYQGLLDSPILKAGWQTRYKNLPSTVIIFITQDDIFGKNLAKYTFSEQCEEISGMKLNDGTKKIFLNMKSRNGRPELISLLQYMKKTELNNPDIIIRDKRIVALDSIVTEVKQSEEWEAVKMNILEIGIKHGISEGCERKLIEQICKKLVKGKDAETISDELEEDLSAIKPIYDVAVAFAPDYNINKIYNTLKKCQKI